MNCGNDSCMQTEVEEEIYFAVLLQDFSIEFFGTPHFSFS